MAIEMAFSFALYSRMFLDFWSIFQNTQGLILAFPNSIFYVYAISFMRK